MILVEIAPTGVRRVVVTGEDALDQDLSLLVWPLVRADVERLDRRLRLEAPAILDGLRPPGRAA
jgi:hypothetical protein